MSIATKRGDGGQTSLAGGIRVSKSDARVETYGTIDELISMMGFARSICDDEALRELTKLIQKELFKVCSAVATPAQSKKPVPEVDAGMVDRLTAEVHRFEAMEGILLDWSVPGEDRAAAAFDVARTICRRAERLVVRIMEDGAPLQPNVLAYLNRLSDLLWLFGRSLDLRAGRDAKLRGPEHAGPRWSRAW